MYRADGTLLDRGSSWAPGVPSYYTHIYEMKIVIQAGGECPSRMRPFLAVGWGELFIRLRSRPRAPQIFPAYSCVQFCPVSSIAFKS